MARPPPVSRAFREGRGPGLAIRRRSSAVVVAASAVIASAAKQSKAVTGVNPVTSVLSRFARRLAGPQQLYALLAIAEQSHRCARCFERWKPTTRHEIVVAASFRT